MSLHGGGERRRGDAAEEVLSGQRGRRAVGRLMPLGKEAGKRRGHTTASAVRGTLKVLRTLLSPSPSLSSCRISSTARLAGNRSPTLYLAR